jgi:hypothetical protein
LRGTFCFYLQGRHIQRDGRASARLLSNPMEDNPFQSHCLQLACLQPQFVLACMAYSSILRVEAAVVARHWYPSTKLHGITFEKTIIFIFTPSRQLDLIDCIYYQSIKIQYLKHLNRLSKKQCTCIIN